MKAYYYKDVIDPTSFDIVHIVFTDDHDGFQAWLNENAPTCRWSHDGQSVPKRRYVNVLNEHEMKREMWEFGLILSSADHAKLNARFPCLRP
jgi:hypothetical protein